MFGFLKRKKKKDNEEEVLTAEAKKHKDLQATLDEELAKEKKREEKKKEKGPNWISFLILLLSLSAAVFFWLYGRIAEMGLAGLKPQFNFSSKPQETQKSANTTPRPEIRNEEGLIIFEKEN